VHRANYDGTVNHSWADGIVLSSGAARPLGSCGCARATAALLIKRSTRVAALRVDLPVAWRGLPDLAIGLKLPGRRLGFLESA